MWLTKLSELPLNTVFWMHMSQLQNIVGLLSLCVFFKMKFHRLGIGELIKGGNLASSQGSDHTYFCIHGSKILNRCYFFPLDFFFFSTLKRTSYHSNAAAGAEIPQTAQILLNTLQPAFWVNSSVLPNSFCKVC